MSHQAVTEEGRSYSPWLGTIEPGQFQAALQRFDLGDFVKATPIDVGLYGQNVFVTSTTGEFVLRGRPVFPEQFQKERFGAALLHERSRVPVAHPYMMDTSSEIFGWPYVIMPRLRGVEGFDKHLTEGERVWVARAIAENLAQMQELTWDFAGAFDPSADAIRPFAGGYADWFVEDARRYLMMGRDEGFITADDIAWVERVISETRHALADDFRACFVMGDYYPGNVLVACEDGEWRVTGLVDLGDYFFGNPEPDLVRIIGVYLDVAKHEDPWLAQAFGAAYVKANPPRPGFVERYVLSMLRDRLQVWWLGKHRRLPFYFPKGMPFRDYAKLYLHTYQLFAPHVR